jgi:16S rRNA (cytidine1402-2'-O)-methyltransferase
MGKLVLVPTPIGNLEDITYRAVRVLKEASLILCEDTRTTKHLLRKFDIDVPTSSYHKFNEHKKLESFIEILKSGREVALVSDAGTPGISDPGFLLIRACLEAGLEIECLPGPTALIPAIVVSGIPCERFVFEGFIPHAKGRLKRLKQLEAENRTMVFYESPYRILKTLNDFVNHLGNSRKVCVVREISKIFEEQVRGTLGEVSKYFQKVSPKGEFVIVVEGLETGRKIKSEDNKNGND